MNAVNITGDAKKRVCKELMVSIQKSAWVILTLEAQKSV